MSEGTLDRVAAFARGETHRANGKPKKKKPTRQPPAMQLTEVDMSAMLVEQFGSELRYCAPLGGWHTWTGTHWQQDTTGRAVECAKALARGLAGRAVETLDPNGFKEARRAGSAAGVRAILELASSAPEIVFTPGDADSDPWALNVGNGTLDFQTGELRAHDRADLITRVCPVDFDPEAEAPMFEKFLKEAQPNPEVRMYLARDFGYAAVGVVREHVLIVYWGPGNNGKSVLAEVAMHVLGGYAKAGPRSLIVRDGKHAPHPADIASCAGTRMVLVHESEKGASFDASKVKLLTGGDRLSARFMGKDYFDFAPTHTLVMLSNYKPQADATDAALWRRIQLVPFEYVVPKEKIDTELSEKIKRDESPGVLRWIVEGALQWQQRGLDPPSIVREQTEAYRIAEDVIGGFIEECCTKNRVAKTKAGLLYSNFKDWCQSQGAHVVRGNDFFAELQARGFRRNKTSTGAVYHGIGLNPSEGDGDRYE